MLPKRTHEPMKPNMMFSQQANQLGMLQGISPYQFDPRFHYDPVYQVWKFPIPILTAT